MSTLSASSSDNCSIKNTTTPHSLPLGILAVLVFALVGRLAFLEYLDLLDPTESRYAFVAQQMVISGNWLTPMLPQPEGLVPYLGKPPLHFWLTALAYEVFGIDEWSSRITSWLGAIILGFGLFRFSRRWFGGEVAGIATLFLLTAGMMFFLSGASVVDVTLTVTVTFGIMCAFAGIISTGPASKWYLLASFLWAGLGFLAKGPYAFVLMALPFFMWSVVRRDFSWLRRIPWFGGTLVLLACIIPWFVLSERAHPGFLHYFVWTENIGRYLYKDYGDKYGTGHVQVYGTSWVMLVLAFMPWTLVWVSSFRKGGWSSLRTALQKNDIPFFVLCWTLSTPLFLTFMRQYHAMYVLPAVPPLALLTAVLLHKQALRPLLSVGVCNRQVGLLLVVIGSGLTLTVVGSFLKFSPVSVLATGAVMAAAALAIRRVDGSCAASGVSRVALMLVSLYLFVLASGVPYVNNRRSAEDVLEAVASDTDCGAAARGEVHPVGVSSHNAYSLYWVAQAEGEIARRLGVRYVAPQEAHASSVCHYLMKTKSLDNVPPSVLERFEFQRKQGDWLVFVRKS